MLINVTQEHIDKGEFRNSECCPIALAIKDKFKVKNVYISANSITIGVFPDEVFATGIQPPEEVKDWILNFDTYTKADRKPVLPFTFELDLTPQTDEEERNAE